MSFFNDEFTLDDFNIAIDDLNNNRNSSELAPVFATVSPLFKENKKLSNDYFFGQNKRIKSKDDEIKLLRNEIKEIKLDLDKKEEIILDMIYTINHRLKLIESGRDKN